MIDISDDEILRLAALTLKLDASDREKGRRRRAQTRAGPAA